MKIEKKVQKKYFEAIIDGKKRFEVRLADFKCAPGDILVLREWNPETKEYTGRQVEKEVSCVVKSKNLKMFSADDIEKYGWQVIGFK